MQSTSSIQMTGNAEGMQRRSNMQIIGISEFLLLKKKSVITLYRKKSVL